ncbi:MAG TPA: hotdog fold thioesterase [Clostridia bacterium]|nr:hotdog fold thioesterase [Clostridia bacterium]
MKENQGQGRMEHDALAVLMGIKILEMRPGYAKSVMAVTPKLLNGVGLTHGGAIFSLADFTLAAASNAHGPEALAINVNIHFLKATALGDVLTATASEQNLTKRTGLYRIKVKNCKGEKIALAEGLVYRRNQ